MKKRQIVGDRDVAVIAGYHEWLIEVSGEVIAAVQPGWDIDPYEGELVANAIKEHEKGVVVSGENTLFCDTKEELDNALYVLNNLTENDYAKIAKAWDKRIRRA